MAKKRRKQIRVPSLRHHKSSGRAVVRLSGKDIYLGPFGSDEATERYNRLVGAWLGNGRCLPDLPTPNTVKAVAGGDAGGGLTVGELVKLYRVWCDARYTRSNQASIIELATRPLVDAFASLPASQFSPNKLRAVRGLMIQKGWSRKSLNRRVGLVRAVFSWGCGRELVDASVYVALQRVEAIPYGAEGVAEPVAKALVSDAAVESIKPFLSRQVHALVRLAMLTGSRMGELVQIRPGDLNRVEVDGVEIIEFTPGHHKTQHKGFDRVIRFGPQAVMILQPFLNRPDGDHCFQPCEAEAERLVNQHAARITPLSCGNRPGTNLVEEPNKKPGKQYDTAVVRKAIRRAVLTHNREFAEDDKVDDVAIFCPHQLRHSALTRIRDQFGVEGARSTAGHQSATMTDIYSGQANTAAREVAAKAG